MHSDTVRGHFGTYNSEKDRSRPSVPLSALGKRAVGPFESRYDGP